MTLPELLKGLIAPSFLLNWVHLLTRYQQTNLNGSNVCTPSPIKTLSPSSIVGISFPSAFREYIYPPPTPFILFFIWGLLGDSVGWVSGWYLGGLLGWNNMYPVSSLHSLLWDGTSTVPSPDSRLLLFSGIYWKLIRLGSQTQLNSWERQEISLRKGLPYWIVLCWN